MSKVGWTILSEGSREVACAIDCRGLLGAGARDIGAEVAGASNGAFTAAAHGCTI